MPDYSDPIAPFGSPASTAVNYARSAALLESLSAIAAECDLLHRAASHHSLAKHVYAIEASIAEMVEEIATHRCGRA
ncbi:MAG TPA: hypothetical protein VGS02_16505 [Acidobacteriaceae bacterium]|nr:hypothetical protein [Acidobacteriaceae bacterium]